MGTDCGVKDNFIIDVAVSNESETEPVSLAEVKEYIRKDFPDDDVNLLPQFITAARRWVEKIAGVSIVEKTITCVMEVRTRKELPYGPVREIVNAANYETQGTMFPKVKAAGVVTVTYTAGYGDDLPTDLKTAIMAKVASMDENRGDEWVNNYTQIAADLAAPYNRVLWV